MKKLLCCPRSMAKPFLHRFRDELTDWCDEHDCQDHAQLVETFGSPQDAAEEFLSQQDAWAINRYAYNRLKRSYVMLAALVTAMVIVAGAGVYRALKPKATAEIRYTHPVLHGDGSECEMFWVKTNFRGQDIYWEYHSCMEQMLLISPPDTADGTEPYAEELYINGKDGVSHWKFNDLHRFWVKVRDDESQWMKGGCMVKDTVHDYLRQLEKHLPCPRTIREPFLRQLEDELEHFCSRNPEADANMLAECFGSPETVAHEFLVETTPETIALNFQKRSKVVIAAVSMVLLVLSAIGFMINQRPAAGKPSSESQVIASIMYAQEDGELGEQSAEVFVSTGAPAQPNNDETKPWYNCILYGGGSFDPPK
ncbi:MAG: hypothetical protein IJ392_09155 [Clostridia bacterium]|nr:hypothetical protein [Clostridia bacterium]